MRISQASMLLLAAAGVVNAMPLQIRAPLMNWISSDGCFGFRIASPTHPNVVLWDPFSSKVVTIDKIEVIGFTKVVEFVAGPLAASIGSSSGDHQLNLDPGAYHYKIYASTSDGNPCVYNSDEFHVDTASFSSSSAALPPSFTSSAPAAGFAFDVSPAGVPSTTPIPSSSASAGPYDVISTPSSSAPADLYDVISTPSSSAPAALYDVPSTTPIPSSSAPAGPYDAISTPSSSAPAGLYDVIPSTPIPSSSAPTSPYDVISTPSPSAPAGAFAFDVSAPTGPYNVSSTTPISSSSAPAGLYDVPSTTPIPSSSAPAGPYDVISTPSSSAPAGLYDVTPTPTPSFSAHIDNVQIDDTSFETSSAPPVANASSSAPAAVPPTNTTITNTEPTPNISFKWDSEDSNTTQPIDLFDTTDPHGNNTTDVHNDDNPGTWEEFLTTFDQPQNQSTSVNQTEVDEYHPFSNNSANFTTSDLELNSTQVAELQACLEEFKKELEYFLSKNESWEDEEKEWNVFIVYIGKIYPQFAAGISALGGQNETTEAGWTTFIKAVNDELAAYETSLAPSTSASVSTTTPSETPVPYETPALSETPAPSGTPVVLLEDHDHQPTTTEYDYTPTSTPTEHEHEWSVDEYYMPTPTPTPTEHEHEWSEDDEHYTPTSTPAEYEHEHEDEAEYYTPTPTPTEHEYEHGHEDEYYTPTPTPTEHEHEWSEDEHYTPSTTTTTTTTETHNHEWNDTLYN